MGTQVTNMAKTKQTAKKATMGAPTLSQNEARRAAARARARCQGGKGQMEDPGGTGQVLLH